MARPVGPAPAARPHPLRDGLALNEAVSRSIPQTFDESLYLAYGLRFDKGYLDLRPGLVLRAEYESYQLVSANPSDVLAGFVTTGVADYEVASYDNTGAWTNGLDAFLAPLASRGGIEVPDPTGPGGDQLYGSGGVLDLFARRLRLPYARLVYPKRFLESQRNGSTLPQQNCVLLAATTLADLDAATDKVRRAAAPGNTVNAAYLRGRTVLRALVRISVNGESRLVPVGTTLGNLLASEGRRPVAAPVPLTGVTVRRPGPRRRPQTRPPGTGPYCRAGSRATRRRWTCRCCTATASNSPRTAADELEPAFARFGDTALYWADPADLVTAFLAADPAGLGDRPTLTRTWQDERGAYVFLGQAAADSAGFLERLRGWIDRYAPQGPPRFLWVADPAEPPLVWDTTELAVRTVRGRSEVAGAVFPLADYQLALAEGGLVAPADTAAGWGFAVADGADTPAIALYSPTAGFPARSGSTVLSMAAGCAGLLAFRRRRAVRRPGRVRRARRRTALLHPRALRQPSAPSAWQCCANPRTPQWGSTRRSTCSGTWTASAPRSASSATAAPPTPRPRCPRAMPRCSATVWTCVRSPPRPAPPTRPGWSSDSRPISAARTPATPTTWFPTGRSRWRRRWRDRG